VPIDRHAQEDDIREAVFRHKMKALSAPVYLAIDGKDPDVQFMQRFVGNTPAVKRWSEGYYEKQPFPGWWRDRQSRKKGTQLFVNQIHWISPSRVEVPGGAYCGGLCGDFGVFRLEGKGGRWVVEEYKIDAIL